MCRPPRLNFPAMRLRARRTVRGVEVWDELRRMWLVLTPEERVRRHLIAYLVGTCGAQPGRIVQEYPVALNGQAQRADVVVVDAMGRPLLLAECKAPEVDFGRETVARRAVAQAVRYNSVLGARWVIVTNGVRHLCYRCIEGRYEPVECFPRL